MADVLQQPLIPRAGILAGAALALFALGAATTTRLTGVGGTHMILPDAVESRDLIFSDGARGAVLVHDFASGRLIDTLAPGSHGFVRVVLRGLARERRLGGGGPDMPFRLTRFANGQLILTDPSSGKQIDLDAFGSANADAFARLMQGGGAP